MRILLSAALLLVTASCVSQNNWSPITIYAGPGHLQLSNFRFDRAQIEAVVAAAPDCSAPAPPIAFELPFKGTRVIDAPGDSDICWRRQVGPGQWTEWNHALIAGGLSIEAQL
ncbi:MAG TPA: hypothetical protein VN808_04255 [Stellaceae bacterium]|nr:hypothetical protein [Stellaceae bacterium]